MDDLISRQALCEYALNQKDKSITPNDIMRFPSALAKDINVPNTDTISRQAVIEAIENTDWYHLRDGVMIHGANSKEDEPLYKAEDVYKVLNDMPSAQPDLSEYSDKLWKAAYERGKAEAQPKIIQCKDCKHSRFFDPCFYCYEFGKEIIVPENGFCFMAERRTDEHDDIFE